MGVWGCGWDKVWDMGLGVWDWYVGCGIGMWGIGLGVWDWDLHWDGGCEVGVEVRVGI